MRQLLNVGINDLLCTYIISSVIVQLMKSLTQCEMNTQYQEYTVANTAPP